MFYNKYQKIIILLFIILGLVIILAAVYLSFKYVEYNYYKNLDFTKGYHLSDESCFKYCAEKGFIKYQFCVAQRSCASLN